MMKKIYTILSMTLMAMCAVTGMAQAPTDAYRNIKNGTYGTARFQGLSGAMGAVGADASAAHVNPAGAVLFQKNTLALGFDLGQWNTSTLGHAGETEAKKFLGNFNHISYFFRGSLINLSGSNYLRVNGGFSYEKEYNYSRSYGLLSGAMHSGITDFMAFRAINAATPAGDYMRDKDYDPFLEPLDPIVTMGMNGEMITQFPYDDWNSVDFESNFHEVHGGNIQYLLPTASDLHVTENGGRNSTDFLLSTSVNDRYFFGAALRLGNSSYDRYSMYREEFDNDSYLEYGNMLRTSGHSVSLNLGAMVALGDYGRLGISYLTPSYAQYEEVYRATSRIYNTDFSTDSKQVDFDSDEYRSSYGMITPGKLTVSAMAFFGRYGFVSYDYHYRNIGNTKLLMPKSFDELQVSQFIREDYDAEHTHKVGVEIRPMSWMSLRGGYSHTGNPMKVAELRKNPLDEDLFYEVPTSGMITDFSIPKTYSAYSIGAGFYLSKGLAIDIAYVHSTREQIVYPFSGYSFTHSDGTKFTLSSRGGQLTESRNSFVTTLTLKF